MEASAASAGTMRRLRRTKVSKFWGVIAVALAAATGIAQDGLAQPSRPDSFAKCGPCDLPGLPELGRAALRESQNDAYKAVDRLLPAAATDSVDAQFSIAIIMQHWLLGHLTGQSQEPFTWRESWVWWHVVAYKSDLAAMLLGGFYVTGEHGLPANQMLAHCLVVGSAQPQPTRERVADCFKRYGVQAPAR